MKVLYAIQGTGNGHVSRAREIIPYLDEFCRFDLLISGQQCDVSLDVPVKYRMKGLSFWFGRHGGVDLFQTIRNANLLSLNKEISQIPVEEYDLVINDFEPVTAWACARKKVPVLSLSHQRAVLGKNAPQPEKTDWVGKFVLKNYAPVRSGFGFHFQRYDKETFTPVIRRQIRESVITVEDHYTVYLPSYDDATLIRVLSKFGNATWHVFSKHAKKDLIHGNVSITPITNDAFVADMAASKGVLCGAGFETPAEALWLNKKLLVIPMKGQFEQQCNAAALDDMGVPVIPDLSEENFPIIDHWIHSDDHIEVDYPDITRKIIRKVFETNVDQVLEMNNWSLSYQMTNCL